MAILRVARAGYGCWVRPRRHGQSHAAFENAQKVTLTAEHARVRVGPNACDLVESGSVYVLDERHRLDRRSVERHVTGSHTVEAVLKR